MHKFSFATAVAALLWALASHTAAQAADLVVLSAAAIEEPFEAVLHAFEHDTGNKVAATFGSVGSIEAKLKGGAYADLVVLSTGLVAAAEKDGIARAGSRAVVGRVEIGVAVHGGSPAPEIAHRGNLQERAADREIGILHRPGGRRDCGGLRRRLPTGWNCRRHQGEVEDNTGREVVNAVVKGDAEIGIGFTSEFVPVKAVKVVGSLPREIEFVNEYSAYIPAASVAPDAAQALLAYLARPASRDIFKAAGAGK